VLLLERLLQPQRKPGEDGARGTTPAPRLEFRREGGVQSVVGGLVGICWLVAVLRTIVRRDAVARTAIGRPVVARIVVGRPVVAGPLVARTVVGLDVEVAFTGRACSDDSIVR